MHNLVIFSVCYAEVVYILIETYCKFLRPTFRYFYVTSSSLTPSDVRTVVDDIGERGYCCICYRLCLVSESRTLKLVDTHTAGCSRCQLLGLELGQY